MKPRGAEARLILLSAAPASRRANAGAQLRELCAEADWERLQAMLAARRLLALLGERILTAGGGLAPAQFAQAVERAKQDARRHGQFLQLLAARVTSALTNAGVASLLLKGPALGELLYGDAGYRQGSDVDVLVAPGDLPRAIAVAVGLGYEPPDDPLARDGLPQLHCTLSHAEGLLPDLELHWRVHWYERSFATDMLRRSSPAADGTREPTAIDGFVSLLLYYARDGFVDVRLLADLIAWWERFQAELPAGSLDRTVREYPALRRALLAALLAGESLSGAPLRNLVGEPRRSELRVRLAARLANPNPRQSLTQLHADVALVDGLLSPPQGRAEFVRRQLLISKDLLEYRARRAQREQVGTPLGHGLRVLARNLLAMPRMLRGAR
jgi:Uncharacterised nucleotidyltransferase